MTSSSQLDSADSLFDLWLTLESLGSLWVGVAQLNGFINASSSCPLHNHQNMMPSNMCCADTKACAVAVMSDCSQATCC